VVGLAIVRRMNALVDPLNIERAAASRRPTVEIVSTFEAFCRLEDEWNTLAARSALPHQVFQDFGILRGWATQYGADGLRLAVVLVRQGGRLTAALPLVRQRLLGLDVLRFMGSPIARFNDGMADRELDAAGRDALRAGFAGLKADLLYAPLVRADSAFVSLGLDQDAIVVGRAQAPFALLAQRVAGEEPGGAYGPKMRSNYRRRVRKLAGDSSLAMRRYEAGKEATALAGQAISMKREWLKRAGIAAPVVFDPRFDAFFRDVAAQRRGLSSLIVSTLERDGRAIGIDLSFDFKGRAFGHVIATDSCAEKDGAGGVLVHHVFAGAKARGNVAFDLLTPADEHKMRHADGVVDVRDLAIPLSPKGRFACATLLARGLPMAKSLARKLPAGLARSLLGRRI